MDVRGLEEWDLLNERQQEQAEDLAELSLKFGKFDTSTGADGAHYARGADNPFKASGLMCSNCVFYDELNSGCQIVTGLIEPEAVCKLWIIPQITIDVAESRSRLEAKKAVLKSLI